MTSQKCSQTRTDGQPCQAWAIRHSNPPTCSAHAKRNTNAGAPTGNQNRTTHGFYSRSYTLDEIADLITYADDTTLDDELAAARIAVRRILTHLQQDLSPDDYAKLAALVFTGTNTVARLLRTQRALNGDTADGISGAIATALDELATEWGIEL